MNHSNSNLIRFQQAIATRLILVMVGVFVCGCIVGGATSRAWTRYQWRMALKNPESLGSRISPRLVRSIGLHGDQLDRVEHLINLRYDRMEALRAETYPLQLAEFDQLCHEIDGELDETQRPKWAKLVNQLKDEYLPVPPAMPPTSDFLFSNFDRNKDDILDSLELPPPMWLKVQKADANGDSKVTRKEFEATRNRVMP